MNKTVVANEYHEAKLVAPKKPHESWTCKGCIEYILWVFSRTPSIPNFYNQTLTL